jgi:peptidoglycan/LPS O-acetylase OafA/YrhL
VGRPLWQEWMSKALGPSDCALKPALGASEKYVGELDGIRAIAVSFVVSAHYGLVPHTPGGFGLTLFFFLSGYLITTLFFSEYTSNQSINIPRFYVRRWLRLTPPLVIFIAVGVLFYPVTRVAAGGEPTPIGTIFAAAFYYTNYYDLYWNLAPDKIIPFGICWSLAVEEHFYLTWPFLIRKLIRNPERLCLVVIALCVSVLAWRIIAREVLLLPDEYTYMSTDCRIDSILYGALLRILFETSWAPRVFRILRSRLSQIVAVCVLMSMFVVRNGEVRETFRYTLQSLALMPVFTAALFGDPQSIFRKVLSSPPMVLIGRLSYSIYLLHLPARTPGEYLFGSPYRIESIVSGLVITLAVSYAVLIFVERPVAGVRRRFRTHPRSRPLTARMDGPANVAMGTVLEETKTGLSS